MANARTLRTFGQMGDRLSPAQELVGLIDGYRSSQAIHVVATLGIPDLLADGPRSADDLAGATSSHPETLYRLLRAVASIGVLHEEDGRRFRLTETGTLLRSGVPDSLDGWARFIGRPSHWQSWGDLLHSVRTGENAFSHIHGEDVWSHRASRPDESAVFDAAMTSLTRTANASLLDAYDFSPFRVVVDVAGGRGALVAALLARYPSMRAILFDLPHVVAGARELLDEAGVADRCELVGGSFFEAVPEGGDAYMLKAIIHDWEDDKAIAILRTCHSAMRTDATLLLVERTLDPPNEGPDGKFSDLNMLVAPAGRERTLAEFEAFFARAGFRLESETPTSSGLSILAGRPVAV